MALPEGLEVKASYLTMILAEEGSPQKIWGKKFVLKCFLVNIKGFKLFSTIKRIMENWVDANPTHPPHECINLQVPKFFSLLI